MSSLLSPGFDPLDSGLHLGLRRERRTWRRQFSMAVLLTLFVGIIWGYWTITDSRRVKAMAEKELSNIIGGTVRIRDATLSIFDGLRLNDVQVFVDPEKPGEPQPAGSRIFSAESLLVRVNLQALLNGTFEPLQIMAVRPQVYLCEDLDMAERTRRWNFTRLAPRRSDATTQKTDEPQRPRILPEFLLRAGRVEYKRIMGGREMPAGELFIDGQVTPRGQHIYRFDFESRAEHEAVGPRLRGYLDMKEQVVVAGFQVDAAGSISGFEDHKDKILKIITNTRSFQGGADNVFPLVDGFEFGHAIRAMLPAEVQEWWARHQLAGRISIPRFFYRWSPDAAPVYQIEVDLDAVRLGIPGEELLGAKEYARLKKLSPGPSLSELPGLTTLASLGLRNVTGPGSLVLRNVTGRFTFTPDRIRFSNLAGRFENNTIIASGTIHDYSPEAPMDIQIAAPNVYVPAIPQVLASLPRDVRKLHSELQPAGYCSIAVGISRKKDEPVDFGLEMRVTNGSFCFHELPYPLERATGIVRFGRVRGMGAERIERVELVNIRGYGASGSLNADRSILVNGFIAPLDRRNAIAIDVKGEGVWLDAAIRKALPREAREVISRFDTRLPDGSIKPAQFYGGFAARARRDYGYGKKIAVHVDLDVADASGAFQDFPYPIEKARGRILVRSNHAVIQDFVGRQGKAVLALDGTVSWGNGRPPEPDLHIRASHVPIDDKLLAALPPRESEWIRKSGIGGIMDVDGRIFLGEDPRAAEVAAPGLAPLSSRSEIRWDLAMSIRDGRIWAVPGTETHAVTDASAELRLTDTDLTISSVRGKRGPADVSGDGYFTWGSGEDRMRLDFMATALPLDKTLYQVIPAAARSAWDELRPAGAVIDLIVHWSAGASTPGVVGAAPATEKADEYAVTVIPRGGSVMPVSIPWKMDDLAGKAVITPGRVDLTELTASHGPARLKLDGAAVDIPGGSEWRLAINASNVTVDEDFLRAVPAGISSLLTDIEYKGGLSIECPTFTYRALDPPASSADTKSTRPSLDEYDFQARLTLHDATMDLGIPVSNAEGTVGFSATIRKGELDSLAGRIELPSLMLAGRPARQFRSNILKPAGSTAYQFAELQGKLAGGELAGQVDLDVPRDESAARYALALVLHGVDIKQLAGEMDDKMKGRLSASLAAEGSWSDPNNRRGRGDIQVQGDQLYRIPVVLGLLQIANLALPIKSPFTDATTTYSIEGQRVTFESISLRAKDMLMQGSGYLDFGSKKVSLSFTTDNPNWPKIPLFNDIIEGAKRELLQIHVRGTVEDPKVGARLLNTVSTTVDEVFKGKPPAEHRNGKDRK